MRAVVDAGKCVSNGLCESLAGSVFKVGDDYIACTIVDPIPDGELAAAEQAVKICPTGAITLENEQ